MTFVVSECANPPFGSLNRSKYGYSAAEVA